MKRYAVLVVVFILMASTLLPAVQVRGSEPVLPDYEPVDWQTSWAGTVEMPTFEETASLEMPTFVEAASLKTVESFATTPPVGTVVWDWYLYAISRTDYGGPKAWMTLRACVGNVEVWVQNDLRFPFNATYSDPRNADPTNYEITDEMAEYIAEVFNSIIYPIDTTYFGKPFDRDGSGNIFIGRMYPTAPPGWWYWIEAPDNPQRVILKILNIRDTNYYDPNYPYYTAGFYSSTYTITYYKRNMIHIDCWRWWERLGPKDYQWYPAKYVSRPNLYESVVAHEYQHNIHRDWNPNDDTFMNEGCSEYAQILCGWPHTLWGHINSYLYTPDNSLTVWGDQGDINILADYGAAALWVTYLSDHYGGADTIRYFVQNGIPGINGINTALEHFGYTQRFDDVYHDWRIANLIHTNLVADGRYNYKTLDLGGPDAIPAFRYVISGIPFSWRKGIDFGTTKTILGYDTGVAKLGPYGSDYIVLNEWDEKGIIYFDGDDTVVFGWTMTADGWYSGRENLMNILLYGEAYVNPASPILEIVTKYDIENLWDFGFVQVSTDGGQTWISQSNPYTTTNHDPGAHPDIVANLPGLTGRSPGWPGWLTMTFDLSVYAGQTVLIGFRYMTDWATLGAGWYIQSASVSGTPLTLTPVYPEADFQVTVIRVYSENGVIKYLVNDVELEDVSETGTKGAYVVEPNYIILVVSYVSQKGWVDYQFKAVSPPIPKGRLLP